ncbi:hypothetical protein RhiirA1_471565 [Rhizophagus irregularis]|uniref:DUF659 domain-containing protein n=2 Tax=Rhizophagus irregularis TaxID=588596 RepID=A0A2N0R415_9GLOM|nr:hypothetical protein RhiirA1_471565 [Rhizophagus irregularis]
MIIQYLSNGGEVYYQEDNQVEYDLLSDIFLLQDKKVGACNWKKAVGKAYEMVDHLALSCSRVSVEVKQIFLEKIRKRSSLKLDHLLPSNNDETATKKAKIIQKKITSIFESDKIEKSKIIRCNRALTRLFVCCGIPFSVMSNPFFVDFVKCLCPAYELPNRVTFAGPWVDQELTNVLEIILSETRSTKNITLGLDGWCGPNGESIYAFILILPSDEILKVIEEVGLEKFLSVISDNVSTMVAAKRLVNKKYSHIMPIVNYFHRSYKAGALLSENIKDNLIEGGGLKGYCKTRWSTAFDCLMSILRCERSLHNILEIQPDTLSSEVKNLLRNQIFFQNVEELIKIIKLIKEVLTSLEYKMTTLLDCFIQLMKFEIMIQIPNVLNQEFHSYCLEKFNLSGGKNLANKLVGQMANYKDFKVPSEFEYIPRTFSIESWWKMIKQHDNWIREIALIINSITPEQGR